MRLPRRRLGPAAHEAAIVQARASTHRPSLIFAAILAALVLVGCSARQSATDDPGLTDPVGGQASGPVAAGDPSEPSDSESLQRADYDPWESFNQKTFWLDHDVFDRFLVKPFAEVWNYVMPYPVIEGFDNAFDNLAVLPRFVNSLLQGRVRGAGREVVRFTLNSTVGVGGFFDVASRLGIEPSDADTGQTLGFYGVRPGPYLVLPLLTPLTVRDAIGYGADSLLDPLFFLLPVPMVAEVAETATSAINNRAEHLELYDGVEESALDLYAAVRNGYLQSRRRDIRDALRAYQQEWQGE